MITGIAEFIKNYSENITINPEVPAYTKYL